MAATQETRAHDLVRGPSMAVGMGVTRCRDSAEPLRDDTGDDDSLAMVCDPAPLLLLPHCLAQQREDLRVEGELAHMCSWHPGRPVHEAANSILQPLCLVLASCRLRSCCPEWGLGDSQILWQTLCSGAMQEHIHPHYEGPGQMLTRVKGDRLAESGQSGEKSAPS